MEKLANKIAELNEQELPVFVNNTDAVVEFMFKGKFKMTENLDKAISEYNELSKEEKEEVLGLVDNSLHSIKPSRHPKESPNG